MSNHKSYAGNTPSNGLLICENNEWLAYETRRSDVWICLKIVSKTQRKNKANYWINWNGERFADGKDYKILLEHDPDLIHWLKMNL